MKDFIEVIDATYAVKNESLKNNSGLVHGTRTLEELSLHAFDPFCDTCAAPLPVKQTSHLGAGHLVSSVS